MSFRWRGEESGGDLGRLVDEWYRHSTAFVIRADGTGTVHERTYTACGTSPDCSYDAVLSVRQSTDGAMITYTRVTFTDSDGQPMTVTPAQHTELDAYFPLPGEQVSATVDPAGRLVLTPLGDLAARSARSGDANMYCGRATTDPGPCGA